MAIECLASDVLTAFIQYLSSCGERKSTSKPLHCSLKRTSFRLTMERLDTRNRVTLVVPRCYGMW